MGKSLRVSLRENRLSFVESKAHVRKLRLSLASHTIFAGERGSPSPLTLNAFNVLPRVFIVGVLKMG